MQNPTLLIMAAGMGSRYGGLKQIDPVGPGGEIVLDYSIHDAARAGFDRVVFVIRRDIEKEFRAAVGSRYEGRLEVDYVFQDLADVPSWFQVPEGRTKPWGTAHAILTARETVHTPFAAINADDFYGAQSFQVLARELEQAEDLDGIARFCMVGFILHNTLSPHGSVARGLCSVDDAMRLQEISEHPSIEKTEDGISSRLPSGDVQNLTGLEWVSMNLWGFTPSFFDAASEQFEHFLRAHGKEESSEYFIPEVVDQLIRKNRAACRVLPTKSSWFGVTYPEDKPFVKDRLAELHEQGLYPSPLWSPA